MAGIWKKMRSENGESLTELLLSVLIVSLAFLCSQQRFFPQRRCWNSGGEGQFLLYRQKCAGTGTGRAPDRWLSFHQWAETSGPVGDGRFGERIGSTADGNDGSYRIILYHAGTGTPRSGGMTMRQRDKKKRLSECGMTLVELLASLLIMSMVTIAVCGGVMAVQKAYRRTAGRSEAELVLATTAELLSRNSPRGGGSGRFRSLTFRNGKDGYG